MKNFCLLLWLCYLVCIGQVVAEELLPLPKLTGHVVDLTATLTSEQQNRLETQLALLEQQKGSQLAVLILPSTAPEDIAQFGIRLAEAWKLGRKNIDDGAIFIIAKNDKKVRIEVGYGLEGVLPDAIAKRVLAENVTPLFKQGEFAGGIAAGVEQLVRLISGESLPPPSKNSSTTEPSGEGWFMLLLFGGVALGSILTMLLGRITGGLLAGLGSGLVATLLVGGGMAVLIGILVFFMVGLRQSQFGGWSSGGGSWGGGSGGGFSGGGGSFGGGGASDSW